MPSLASLAAPLIGGITLSGLATGAAVLGTGLSVVGAITGNKTLQKVGMGLGIAGGVGLMAGGMRGAAAVTGELAEEGMAKNALNNPLKSAKPGLLGSSNKFKQFTPASDSVISSADSFKESVSKMSGNVPFNPETEKSFWERGNEVLTKFNPALNVLGGMGQAYVANEGNQLRKDLLDKEIDFRQQEVDIKKQATQPMGFAYSPNNFTRKPLLLQ